SPDLLVIAYTSPQLLAVTPMCCSGPYHRLYHCSAKFGVPAARDSVTEWSICTLSARLHSLPACQHVCSMVIRWCWLDTTSQRTTVSKCAFL
ncbi:hypothetical protein B0H14DRAFT_2739694, partial [Mycena olivaceomarginata]